MKPKNAQRLILDALANASAPMTRRELIEATQINSNGVYLEVYKLQQLGKIQSRPRPHRGRSRPELEFFIRPPSDTVNLEDFEDEIPDEVWWPMQAERGFSRYTREKYPTIDRS